MDDLVKRIVYGGNKKQVPLPRFKVGQVVRWRGWGLVKIVGIKPQSPYQPDYIVSDYTHKLKASKRRTPAFRKKTAHEWELDEVELDEI